MISRRGGVAALICFLSIGFAAAQESGVRTVHVFVALADNAYTGTLAMEFVPATDAAMRAGRWSALAIAGWFAAAQPSLAQRPSLEGIDAFIDRALVEWQTPGLTLTIVRHDSVLVAKGYGVRETGRPERVDENTLFNIGSCSKAFASATVLLTP